MPQILKMTLGDDVRFHITLKKYSREDIYGKKRREKRSTDNKILKTVSINIDGLHILPKGSVSRQFINKNGDYVDSSQVKSYTEDGEIVEKIESMFQTGVELEEIPIEEYFRYNISTTYHLNSDQDFDQIYELCQKLLNHDKLLKFKFTYRSTTHPQVGILIPVANNIIIAVGLHSPCKFVSKLLNLDDIIQRDEDEKLKFEDVW